MFKKLLLTTCLVAISFLSQAQLRIRNAGGSVPLGFNTDGGVAEITAFDPITKQLFCINGNTNEIAVYDFSNPANAALMSPIQLISVSGSGSINSIACYKGLLAVVYENASDRTLAGAVQLYTTTGMVAIGTPITVGAQPDMITFTPDGKKLLIANEGEPNNFYTVDPEGSVTIIDVTNPTSPVTSQTSLVSLNGSVPHLSTQPTTMPGIRIFGMINSLESTVAGFALNNTKTPSTVAQDLEPEYITVSADNATAWVTCQENNAVLIIDINNASITGLVGLGYKNHNISGNGMDISRSPANPSGVNITTYPFKGMYQPDGISVTKIGGVDYLFTANEGDARAYTGFNEELDVNAAFFPRINNGASSAINSAITLSGIRITNTMGNTNGGNAFMVNSVVGQNINVGNNFEELYTYGTRSFSIWNGATGALVWDSGDAFERQTFASNPNNFNADHNGGSANNTRRRSTTKGPEPESIVSAMIGDSVYAFIGLERIGGVMVYNVTNPTAPIFKQYINTRNFSLAATGVNSATGNDLGPEGLTLIKAEDSPNGIPYLVVSNEISGTLRIFALEYNITRNNPSIFIIAANQTESPVQIISLTGSGLPSTSITLNAPADFQISLSSTSGFGSTISSISSASLASTTIFAKYMGTSAFTSSIMTVSGLGVGFTNITLTGSKLTTTPGAAAFTLQVLHASDFEAGLAAMDNAPRFAAIWDKFNGDYPNTLRVSGGDNFLPSPFFNAAADGGLRNTFGVINNGLLGGANGANYREGIGRGDINIMNLLDLHASAVGNHEFDAGTGTFAEMIGINYNDAANPTQVRWAGTRFPYLSCNLDFSADANLAPLYTSEIRPVSAYKVSPVVADMIALSANQRRKIAPATVVTIGGETIGIVGATTQVVERISSTGQVRVIGTNVDNMPLLASQIQPVIDQLRARGINKIVLLSHLQQIANEKALAPLLSGVDIIVAAGSHTLMADNDDILEGDTRGDVYPFTTTGIDGGSTIIVSTAAEYSYVGRLVIDFDANGNVIPSSYVTSISGAWKATDLGMQNASVSSAIAFSGVRMAQLSKGLIEGINASASQPNAVTLLGITATLVGIRGIINTQDGNIFGKTQVFMEGRREGVRQQETNLGNVTSDANLWYARSLGFDVQVSLKNGGGIRASLGIVSAVGSNFVNLPPLANPSAGKQTGDISQLDIANALRFNNGLSVVTITAAQLLQTMNHSVAASTATATPGQFAQHGGMRFSFDITRAAGSRVRSLAIVDDLGNVTDVIAENGSVVGNAMRTFGMVTLNFMVNGGDSYPFPSFNAASLNRQNVYTIAGTAPTLGFTDIGSEQQGFAQYLLNNFNPSTSAGYNIMDTPSNQDLRTQNLSVRSDEVLPSFSMPLATITAIPNELKSLSNVSISGMRLAVPIQIMTPSSVSVNGVSMVTVSGMGGSVTISALAPNSVGTSTFTITLTSANIVRTFTHTLQTANQIPTITFNGASLTVGGSNLDLSTLLSSNSTGVKSFSILAGNAASISGTSLVAINAGMVTVTGSVSSVAGFDAGSLTAVFTIANQIPMITFTGASLTVGGANVDLSTLLLSNSTGAKSFTVNGSAASLSGNNLVGVDAGTVTVTGFVASTTGFNAVSTSAVFSVFKRSPMITFTGATLTIGGANIDLNTLFVTNSTGAKSYSITGISVNTILGSIGGSNLISLNAGSITVTGMVAATAVLTSGMATAVFTIVENTTTSIKSASPLQAAFDVYPNPVSGGIIYFTKTISGAIYSISGAEIVKFKNANYVDVAGFANGTYIIKTSDMGQKTFIVK